MSRDTDVDVIIHQALWLREKNPTLTCQGRENGERQANRNVACEKAELADRFVAVPDCSREFVVAHRIEDDCYKEAPSTQRCVERRSVGSVSGG